MKKVLLAFLALLAWTTAIGAGDRRVPSVAQAPEFDLVIENARVTDPESGLDAVRNVGIRDRTIAAIESRPLQGRRRIEARGLVLSPGFIDLHRHGQNAENYRHAALDGVTSVFELEVGTGDIARWYREREPGQSRGRSAEPQLIVPVRWCCSRRSSPTERAIPSSCSPTRTRRRARRTAST